MAILPAPVDGVPDALLPEEASELQALLAAPGAEAPPAPSRSVSPIHAAASARVETPSVASMGVRVSVVIPTLNEEQNLPYVFARLPEGLHEVIVVDGNSIDHTVAIARRLRPDVRVLMQTGRGKGNALATGLCACTGDIVVTLDADGSTDAREIPRFVAALCHGADFVKGSRFAQGGASADITPIRKLGNRALGALVNALYRTSYTDLCYGYNAFWASCLPYMRVDCDGFEVETLINVRIAKAGLVVHEVPSYERSPHPRHKQPQRNARWRSSVAHDRVGADPSRATVLARSTATASAAPMRIALVTPRYASHAGALERHVRELARGLTRRGAAVEVITQEREHRLLRDPLLEDVLVRRFPMSHHNARFAVTPALSEYLRHTASSFDLVHTHSAHVLLGRQPPIAPQPPPPPPPPPPQATIQRRDRLSGLLHEYHLAAA